MKVVFSIEFVCNSNKRSTSSLWNSIIYNHHIIFVVSGNGGVATLQYHIDVINTTATKWWPGQEKD